MRAPHLLYIRCGARFVCEIGAKMVLVLFFSVMSIFLFDARSFDFVFLFIFAKASNLSPLTTKVGAYSQPSCCFSKRVSDFVSYKHVCLEVQV